MVEKMGMSELIGPRALFNTIPTPMQIMNGMSIT